MTAVLDAGIGGLFILSALMRKFPKEPFIYLADREHFPYGGKPAVYIAHLLKKNVQFLSAQGADRVIVACNTASAVLEEGGYPILVKGVISASLRQAQIESQNGQVGVLATAGTVHSKAFINQAQKQNLGLTMYQQACPLLADFVEQGGWQFYANPQGAKSPDPNLPRRPNPLDQYLPPLLDKGVDTIIMGCTHYLYLKPLIEEYLGVDQKAVGPVDFVLKDMIPILQKEKQTGTSLNGGSPVRLFVSGPNQEEYKNQCRKVLDHLKY